MKELIMILAETTGPIGQEENVRALLKEAVADLADEVREDVLGNLIVTKKGTGADKKHLVLVAHMDEPALMVNFVEGDGYLRVAPVGAFASQPLGFLVGQRFAFPNGVVGVLSSTAQDPGDVNALSLFLDIGASSKEEALSRVELGDFCALVQPAVEIAPNKLVGKALDSRVSCAIAVEALKRLDGQTHDVSVVFTVQQGLQGRGVKPAITALDPDFALVFDAVRTGDVPGAGRSEVKLGGGVAVKVIDKTAVILPQIKNYLIDQSEAVHAPYQIELTNDRAGNAGSIFTSVAGVPVGALSVPIRYNITGSEMVDLRDAEAAVQVTVAVLKNYA